MYEVAALFYVCVSVGMTGRVLYVLLIDLLVHVYIVFFVHAHTEMKKKESE